MKNLTFLIAVVCLGSFKAAEALHYMELQGQCKKEQIAALYEALDHLQIKEIDRLKFEPLLGGMSATKLYTFNANNQDYVLRFLKLSLSLEERKKEIQALCIAHALDIAPPCTYVDQYAFLTLFPLVHGHTLSSKDLEKKSFIATLGKTIQKLHSYSNEFPEQSTLIQRIQQQYEKGKNEDAAYPTGFYEEVIKIVNEPTQELFTPCHGDLNPTNILIENDKPLLIDWTTATWDDPFSDLGCLCLSANMSKDQEEVFLEAYLGRIPTSQDIYRLEKGKLKTSLAIATFWFRFATQEKEQIPIKERIARIDTLLQSEITPSAYDYLQKGALPNLKTAPKEEIQTCALAFYKFYLENSKKLLH